MSRLVHAWRLLQALVRPGFALIVVFAELVGLLQRDRLPSSFVQASLTVAVLAWMLGAAALNDVADEPIDRVNLVDDARRVLVTGLASRRRLAGVAVAAFAVALAAAAATGWRAAAVMVAGVALAAAYSLHPVRLSDRGLLTAAVLPLGYVGVPLLLGASAGSPSLSDAGRWAAAGLVVAFTGRLVLKDFRDVDGDRLFGKRTLLVRYGRRTVCAFAALLYLAGTAPLLVVTSSVPSIAADLGVLSVLTVALLVRLERAPATERLTISAIALLGRGQLATVCMALAIRAGRLSPGDGALAAFAILLGTLHAAWLDHSRFRYQPAAALPVELDRRAPDAALRSLTLCGVASASATPDARATSNAVRAAQVVRGEK